MPAAAEVEALRQRLLYDTPFFAKNCLWIVNKQRQVVRLNPLPWQARTPETPAHMTPLDEALEKQRAAGQPMRAIIGKARKLGMCLAPYTRVLTADLRWVPIDSIRPGDRLVGCDEFAGTAGNARKMRVSTAEAVRYVHEVAYRVKLDNGAEFVATGLHRFLCQWGARTETRWRTVEDMKVGYRIRHVVKPWGPPDYDDGWMAGMLDGEGSLRPANVSVYQRPGDVTDRAVAYFARRGYEFSVYHRDRVKAHHSEGVAITVRKRGQMLRLVGSTRPARWTGDPSWWEGRELPAKNGTWPSVVSIERLDRQPMVDLQTDHKTFVAEGFVSHNSTWVQAKATQRVTQLPFQNALTVCHRADATVDMADMAFLMYERLPTDAQLADLIFGEDTTQAAPFSVRPQKLSSSNARSNIRFMELGSKVRPWEKSIYRTLTAGSKGGGRAGTPSIIHASEFAHYEDPDYSVGLFNALPLEPETIGVIESTANGFNHFFKLWDLATRGAEDPDTGVVWVPLFYGWHDNPRNSLPFVTEQARERFERTIGDEDGGGDPEEVLLVESFGVTLEQLNWRRAIINGPEGNGSIEWFHQEHPTTAEQMFIGSGRPVFPGILVARAIREASEAPAPVEGVLRGVDWRERKTRAGTVNVPQRVMWVPGDMMEPIDLDRWGPTHRLRVWAHPLNEATQSGLTVADRKPDGQYVVFVDVAQGSGSTADDGDYSAIQVLDHLTRQQVASYRSRVPIHDLPLLAYMVGVYYNRAWMAVEVQGLGIGVVDAMAKDYRYSPMYRRHRAGDDERADTRERLLGWSTDLRTKPLMEQTFGQALREGTHGLRDVPTAREFSTYVSDPKNPAKHGAQAGAHDDLAMAMMGVHRVAAELRPRDMSKRRRQDRWLPADDVLGY